MHVLDLFNDKDRNFLNGGSAISEGGMPDLNLEYQDYLKLPQMAFQSRYKISKEAWAEKYKNLLPKPVPRDPTAGMPAAPLEEGDVISMPARARTATPQSAPADVIPMIKDRSNRAYEMWKQRILRRNSDSAEKIKFYSKGNKIVAQIPSMAAPLGTFDIDTYTGTVQEGVRDLGYDAQSLIMKLRRDVEEKRLQPTRQAVLAAANELAGNINFAPELLVQQVLGKGVAEADMNRRGFLKGMGAAAVTAVAGNAMGQSQLPMAGLPNVDQVDRQKMTITLDGKEYPLVILSPTDFRPRGGQQVHITCAQMGERCPGRYDAVLAQNRVFVLPGIKPNSAQPTSNAAPARIDAPTGPSGFSKEYLQKAADPNRTGIYLISVEKAQQLLTQMQEGVAEGEERVDTLVTTGLGLMRGPKWLDAVAAIKYQVGERDYRERKQFYDFFVQQLVDKKKAELAAKKESVAEGHGEHQIRPGMRVSQGTVVKVNGNTVTVKASNGDMMTMNIHDVDQGVAEADMNRRGFLKTAGAAAMAGIGANSQAQPDQRQDLGNSFVTATATIDGITYRAIQDTISKSGYMLNNRGDGTPIVNRPGEFLVIRNGKIEARPSLAPNITRALQKAGILSADDSQVSTQTSPAVTHSSHGGTNQPAVTHSSRGGTNQPAVTHSSSNRKPRNEDTTSRMKMDDYIKAADSLQSKLSNAIKLGDKELIQKLSKERDDLDARVKQHGLVPEASKVNQLGKQPVGEANMQSLIVSYKNLIKRALGVAFGKKQNTSDPMAFQRMMRKVTAPLDSTQYAKLWQEYKNNPQYYISLPTMDEIENNKKVYFWSNSLAEFVINKFPDASKEALLQAVEGLAQLAADEFKNKHRDLDEATQQKPRVRKYTKMRPDGSKAVRYEVLDHMGRRITGQGPEGFDDPKLAKDFYYKNYDRLASLDEIVDRSVSDTPTKPDMKKANGRYWCSEEKRWKDH